MSTNTKLSATRGESFILPIQVAYADGTYFNIEGMEFTGSAKETYTGELVYPLEFVVLSEESGSLEMSMETSRMLAGDYVYTSFIISGSYKQVLLEGQLTIAQSTI